MKRLFKLGLVALMGICGLVSMGHAQTAVLIDTTASATANCTLQADGSWKMDQDNGLRMKVNPILSDTTFYRVAYTCKQDGTVKKQGTALVRNREGWYATPFKYELASLDLGTYTIEFTGLDTRPAQDSAWVAVTGVTFPPVITVEIAGPSFKVTAKTAHTEVEENLNGENITRLVFPTHTAPEFTVTVENGDADEFAFTAYLQDELNYFQATMYTEPFEFTFKPVAMGGDEEEGPSIGTLSEETEEELPEYFEDGDYMITVEDATSTIEDPVLVFIRIGTVATYGFEAVGATTETEEGDEYKKFGTDEATFAVIAENAPADWYAEVSILDADDTYITGATLMSGDSVAAFTTLAGGQVYYANCQIYNVKGVNVGDTVLVWSLIDRDAIPFMVEGEILATDPVLTVEAAGKFTMNDNVIVFDSVATFKMKVTGLAEDDDLANYTITARIYKTDSENPAEIFDEEPYDGTDTVATLIGIWNGEYSADFFLTRISGMMSQELDPVGIDFTVTNYEEWVDPVQISVKAVGNTEEDGKVIFANGENIAFDIFVEELPANDTNYKIDVYIWTKEEVENAAGSDAIRLDAKDSIRFNAEGVYFNHEYVAKFDLMKYDERRGEFMNAKNTEITFFVTENPEPEIPGFAVAAVANTKQGDSIIFADGNVNFDMFVKDLAANDSIFEIRVTVWDTTDTENYALADVFKAADSVRFVNNYYNGVYEAIFELGYKNGREFISAVDTTILFFVTENEEPVENYEFTVEPVGATKDGENYTFAAAEVAFDIAVKGMTEADDNLVIYAKVYTKKQYDSIDSVGVVSMKAAASVRFNDTLENGEYVAEFQLMRTTERGDIATNADDVTIHFTVKKEQSANEAAELAGVNVYPNPNAGTFNVAVPERARIDIFGLNGAKVLSREVNAGVEAFQLNHSGIYFVRVMAGNKTAVKRVVVR